MRPVAQASLCRRGDSPALWTPVDQNQGSEEAVIIDITFKYIFFVKLIYMTSSWTSFKKIKGKQSLSKHTIRHFGWFFRIHSLSLQDLRQFIDPDAPKTNGIPTINFDQTSDNVILNNTRDDPNLFAASGLRAFDSVLSHVKNLQYEIAKGKH